MTDKYNDVDNLSASTSADCSANPEQMLSTDSCHVSMEHVLANVVNFDEDEIKIAIGIFEKNASLKKYWDANTFKHILEPTFTPSVIEGIVKYASCFGNGHVSVTDFVTFLSSLASGPEAERFKNLSRIWDDGRKDHLSVDDVTRLCHDCGISLNEHISLNFHGGKCTFDEVAIWGTKNRFVGRKMLRFLFLLVNVLIGYPTEFNNVTLPMIVDDCVAFARPEQFKHFVIVSTPWYETFISNIGPNFDVGSEPEDEAPIFETIQVFQEFRTFNSEVIVLRKELELDRDYVPIPLPIYCIFFKELYYKACIRSCDAKWDKSMTKKLHVLDLYPPYILLIRRTSSEDNNVESLAVTFARTLDIYTYFSWLLKQVNISNPSRLRMIQRDGMDCDVLITGGDTLESLKVGKEAAFFVEEKYNSSNVWSTFDNLLGPMSTMTTSMITNFMFSHSAVGLSNLGNTCYFNSVIQCLSSLSHSKKYFSSSMAKSFDQTNGLQFVTELSTLFDSLQRSDLSYVSPKKLFSVFQSKTGGDFRNYVQHDAHEALIAILNIIHHEMADHSSKPDFIPKATDPLEATKLRWINHQKQEGSSPIGCFFTGAVISNLCCRVCLNQSPTIEAFQTYDVSLDQVSGLNLKYLVVNKTYTNFCAKTKYLPPDATLTNFLKEIALETQVPLNRLFFYVQSKSVDDNREYNKNPNFLMSIFADKEKETFIVYELPKPLLTLKDTENYAVCFQLLLNKNGFNKAMNRYHYSLFQVDIPLIFKISNGMKNESLYELVMATFLKMKDVVGFSADAFRRASHQYSKDKYPFHLVHVNNTGKHCSLHDRGYGCRIPINAEVCDFETLSSIGILWKVMPYYLDYRNVVDALHSTSAEIPVSPKHSGAISVLDCLSKASCPELMDGLINCEKCAAKKIMTKTCKIYLAPAVFMVHFKRFILCGNDFVKDTRKVTFPLDDLDLTPFIFEGIPIPNKYQCVAFIIHQGTLVKGHYIAFVRRNFAWYMISDDIVTAVNTDELLLADAVLVFYEMKGIDSPLIEGHPLEDYVREQLTKFNSSEQIVTAKI
uniref:USP domain-containing protein n=1 Tax=Panagrolaimus sp. JU765 TaxID=591449 RepID=A0AC34Q673_9BILA